MVWNSTWPDGSKSVKQNTIPGQQNTTYTETTLNNDHFWNIGTDEDGHHRAINMLNYADTASGAPADAPIATGMDGVFYLKTTSGRVQGFYQNAAGIYQYIPAFLSGTAALTSSYTTVINVPDNTYGQIWIWRQGNNSDVSFGSFIAQSSVCQAFSAAIDLNGSSTPVFNVHYGNGTAASGLNVRAKVTGNASAGTYNYRIIYWSV